MIRGCEADTGAETGGCGARRLHLQMGAFAECGVLAGAGLFGIHAVQAVVLGNTLVEPVLGIMGQLADRSHAGQ